MTVGSNTLLFTYGINGQPMSVNYNGTDYYYITNSQGDVVGILNGSGTEVVTYTYDAWGNLLSTTGSMATTLGAHNPLLYRSYVYDRETSLYYLQSRYYNPTIGRFISADNYPSTGQGLTGNNMFIYCGNNPVSRADEGGEFWNIVIGAVVGAVVGGAVAAYTSYKQNGMIDWASVAISAAVGGVCGAVAATGLNMFVQAGISAFASGAGNLFDQAQSKGWDGINGWDVAVSTALGFGTALLGTGAGKIIGGKWAKEASRLSQLGKDKLLTGFLRQSVGQSHSSLMGQGYRYIAQAVRSTNIYQGVSSVAGSFIGGAVGFGYNMLKSSVLGW